MAEQIILPSDIEFLVVNDVEGRYHFGDYFFSYKEEFFYVSASNGVRYRNRDCVIVLNCEGKCIDPENRNYIFFAGEETWARSIKEGEKKEENKKYKHVDKSWLWRGSLNGWYEFGYTLETRDTPQELKDKWAKEEFQKEEKKKQELKWHYYIEHLPAEMHEKANEVMEYGCCYLDSVSERSFVDYITIRCYKLVLSDLLLHKQLYEVDHMRLYDHIKNSILKEDFKYSYIERDEYEEDNHMYYKISEKIAETYEQPLGGQKRLYS